MYTIKNILTEKDFELKLNPIEKAVRKIVDYIIDLIGEL